MPHSNVRRFTVKRHEPELVRPAEPTPQAPKPLSDIDDQESLRFLFDIILIYPGNHNSRQNPTRTLKDALAKALVFYHPFAGRLGEGPGRKLVVDCTGEGLMFVEAEADITLEDLAGESGVLHPPLPCYEELRIDVPGILNCPLLHIQVTRFKCGGFLMAVRVNHPMTDTAGIFQFLNAVAEIARGASQPSILPVWGREILCSRNPPRVTCTHREYEGVDGPIFPFYNDNTLVDRSFFFGPNEISTLRRHLPPDLRRCSNYELLSAFLWRCRTIALQLNPDDEVRHLTVVKARSRYNPLLPKGYYGNTFAFPAAISTAGEISTNGLGYVVELVRKDKAQMTEEYIQLVADYMASRGRPHFKVANAWITSDNTSFKFLELDYGFGKPNYGGPASALVGVAPGPTSFFAKARNAKGEIGVLLLICLPVTAMERFSKEARGWSSQGTNSKL